MSSHLAMLFYLVVYYAIGFVIVQYVTHKDDPSCSFSQILSYTWKEGKYFGATYMLLVPLGWFIVINEINKK